MKYFIFVYSAREASDSRVAEFEKKLEAAEKRRVTETGALQKRLDAHMERLKEDAEKGQDEVSYRGN